MWIRCTALAVTLTGAGLTGISTLNACVLAPQAARLGKLEEARVQEVRDRAELLQRVRVLERQEQENSAVLRRIEARLRDR
jgi:hypothetical protein